MNENEGYGAIKQALAEAPRNQCIAELHLQMIKYADELKYTTAKEFCEGVGLRNRIWQIAQPNAAVKDSQPA